MYKRLRIATGVDPGPAPFHLANGTIINIPRTQMKGVYNRFKTHTLVKREPNTLEFRATMTAKVLTLLLFLCGFTLIFFTIAAGLFTSFIFGGIILIAIGAISAIAWMESILLSIDKRSGMISIQKTGPLKQDRPLIIALSDIAAIQVLSVEIDNAYDVMVTTYEINLVFAMPVGERTWLLSYGNHSKAQETATQLAIFLNRSVLEHSAES